MRSFPRVFLFALHFFCGLAAAQAPVVPWIVRPAWVKAHEDFLAGDALNGRGSATRDEHIAAEYVASQFEGFGLQHAPGMDGYLQQASVAIGALDGHAMLTAGTVTLQEGRDFLLLVSSGGAARGALAQVSLKDGSESNVTRGTASFAAELPVGVSATQVAGKLRHRGAPGLVLVPEDASTQAMFTALGGRTRTPARLAEEPHRQEGMTLIALAPSAVAALRQVKDGTPVDLQVHPEMGPPRSTFNAIGWLPGTDPAGEVLLLTAHLDHLGVGRPVNGDALYNGANDDASGTTAVLELAHALAYGPPLRRSVLFVCYGSEELGELGSTYFAAHPPLPLKRIVANLEFEMIGNQDPKMPRGVLFLTGWERSDLGPTLKQHGALLGPDPSPEEHFFERSDNYALALRGIVAHTASGWGTVPTYHQPDDDVAHLDLPFMTAAIQSLVEPLRWLASSDFTPHWNSGGRPRE